MRRGLVNVLLFIYLALLPIGFNYGWLFQVGNRHASKTLLFCVSPLFLWQLGTWEWGSDVCAFLHVSVHLPASLNTHLSGCIWTHVVIDEHFFCVCMLARCHVCARLDPSCFPGTAAAGLDWCVTQDCTLKGREAWADVVLLVYQMGLYDEKSIIPHTGISSISCELQSHSQHFIVGNNLFIF